MTETVITVNSQQTTNSTYPSGGGGLSWIKMNTAYFMTMPGIIKIVQVILGILCMALATPAYFGATGFFVAMVVIIFIATILWSAVYFLGVREALTLPFNWILTELINTGIAAIIYFIASVIQLAKWSDVPQISIFPVPRSSNIAAGVFGIFNFIAYAVGSYFLYLEFRRSN